MANSKPAPVFAIGLFFGILLGWLGSFILTDRGATTAPPKTAGGGAKKVAAEDPHSKQPDQPENPHAKGGHGAGADRAKQSFAKVHFMKKFVQALSGTPANKWPNPSYKPLLKDPEDPVQCTGCHNPESLNIEGMIANDPGAEAVEPYRKSPRFMIALMQKWVARLNKEQGKRLAKVVTCDDCHAIPAQDAWTELPKLMVKFAKALKEKPANKNPASGWKPLLKDAKTPSLLCGTCHGEVGAQMEREIGNLDVSQPVPAKYADNKVFMVELMERWVEKLNRDAKGLLAKQVGCLDCHETDPRK